MKYRIEERAGVMCVVYSEGGVRPATDVERELWAEIERKNDALRKLSEHGEEMSDRCEMAVGTKDIADQALQTKGEYNETD